MILNTNKLKEIIALLNTCNNIDFSVTKAALATLVRVEGL